MTETIISVAFDAFFMIGTVFTVLFLAMLVSEEFKKEEPK